MADFGFADRLEYVRYLRLKKRGGPRETDQQLADAWGVGVKWLGKWKLIRDRSPTGRKEAAAIEAAIKSLGVSLAWLYDGVGEPPHPAKWAEWLPAYRALGGPVSRRSAADQLSRETGYALEQEGPAAVPNAKPAARRATGGNRDRGK